MLPPRGALGDDAVWHLCMTQVLSWLYDWHGMWNVKFIFICLSVAYIGLKSRTERPRKTKIGTEVAHVTRDSDITFKVTKPLWLVVLVGQHGHTVMVTYTYAYMTSIVSPLAGLGGGISWRPPTYNFLVERNHVLVWKMIISNLLRNFTCTRSTYISHLNPVKILWW